jgi:CRP-like cAMP-binding protein
MKIKNIISLFRKISIKSYRKGEILIAQGAKDKEVFFIRKGVVRSYLIDENGAEISFQLYEESNVFTNVHGILFNEKSKFFYQALEDLKVYIIPYDDFMKMSSNNQELLELNRTFFGKKIIQQAFQRIESFVFLSPEERYKKFITDHPKLANRVPDMYIASILGITPVSLSRIKRRISKKK